MRAAIPRERCAAAAAVSGSVARGATVSRLRKVTASTDAPLLRAASVAGKAIGMP